MVLNNILKASRDLRRGVAFFCAGNAIIPITAAALVLPIQQTYIEEGKANWSWAACSQAVMEYFGVSMAQVEIGDYGANGQDIMFFSVTAK